MFSMHHTVARAPLDYDNWYLMYYYNLVLGNTVDTYHQQYLHLLDIDVHIQQTLRFTRDRSVAETTTEGIHR